MAKKVVGICLSQELLAKIDIRRGLEPRSGWIERRLRKIVEDLEEDDKRNQAI